ncbi:MAG: CaiB/BaiF CoA-transferase family protein [Chloroflexota bacterium]
MEGSKALDGLRVLELPGFVAGSFCTRLLADLGAEVIGVEPPGKGNETRRRGPFRNDVPDIEGSALFLYLQAGKLGITLDAAKAPGRKVLGELLAQTDVLVVEDSPRNIAALGLDLETLRRDFPRLVTAAITPFGLSGPYCDYKAYYLNTFEAGGEGYTLPSDRANELYADRQPVRMGSFASEYSVGAATAVAVLACLFRRENGGPGDYIEVSKQEVLLNLVRGPLAMYNMGVVLNRSSRTFPLGGLLLCRDGWVLLLPLNPRLWDRLMAAMGNPDWAKEERFQYAYLAGTFRKPGDYTAELYRAQHQANEYLQEWCARYTKEEITRIVQSAESCAGGVYDVEDILNSEQLQHRGFFTQVNHPVAGTVSHPVAPYLMARTPAGISRPAPVLGEHNELVYQRLGYGGAELARLRREGAV